MVDCDGPNLRSSSRTWSDFPRWPWWGWAGCCQGWDSHWWSDSLSADASHRPAQSLRSRSHQWTSSCFPPERPLATVYTTQTAVSHSQLAVGDALWSLALISLSRNITTCVNTLQKDANQQCIHSILFYRMLVQMISCIIDPTSFLRSLTCILHWCVTDIRCSIIQIYFFRTISSPLLWLLPLGEETEEPETKNETFIDGVNSRAHSSVSGPTHCTPSWWTLETSSCLNLLKYGDIQDSFKPDVNMS